MRGRVVFPIVVLSLFLLPYSLSAQCAYLPVYSGQFRSTALDVALDGNDLWVATAYGVSLYDRSVDPPVVLASQPLAGLTNTIRTANGIAYAGSGSTVAVLKHDGVAIRLLRTIEIGGDISDLASSSRYLYVAASNGITQLDLLDPQNPAIVNGPAKFPVSGTTVTSLAISASTLFVADGDASVEVFTVAATPQKTGTVAAFPATQYVSVAAGYLQVSDGIQTDVFNLTGAMTLVGGPLPLGTITAADVSGTVAFTAGRGRRFTAYDYAVPGSPVELYGADLPSSGGTVNAISGMVSSGARLYIAGGDAGLVTYDTSGFASPFPLHGLSLGSGSAVSSLSSAFIVALSAGGLAEVTRSATGAVTLRRQWDGTRHDVVQDSGTDLVLTSSGTSVTLWTLISSVPAAIGTATFSSAVRAAVLSGSTAYVLLDNHTIWSATMQDTPPKVLQKNVPGAPSFLVRSGTSLATADLNADGSTTLRYYANGDLLAMPASIDLTGTTSAGITLFNGAIAAWTYEGLSVATLTGSPSVRTLPQSTSQIPVRLILSGATLLSLSATTLDVWNTASGTLTRRFALPATALGMDWFRDGADVADVATTDGILSVAFRSTSRQPLQQAWVSGSSYYRKEQLSGNRLYLFDGRRVDSYEISASSEPANVVSVRGIAGVIDAAGTPSGIVAVSGSGLVSLYTAFGSPIAQTQIAEGSDVIVRSVTSVGGAAWVSLEKGCLTGTCEKKTLVFDPRNGVIAQTAILTGSLVEVTASGARAYAITDLPSEIRVIDITDAFHPGVLASRPSEGASRGPVSIAYSSSNSTIYALGEKLYSYTEQGLAKSGELLSTYVADPSGSTTYIDQRVRIDGVCAIVTGRAFAPQLYSIVSAANWIMTAMPAVPAAVRGAEVRSGQIYLLTDSSIELWSTTPLPPHKHRIAR